MCWIKNKRGEEWKGRRRQGENERNKKRINLAGSCHLSGYISSTWSCMSKSLNHRTRVVSSRARTIYSSRTVRDNPFLFALPLNFSVYSRPSTLFHRHVSSCQKWKETPLQRLWDQIKSLDRFPYALWCSVSVDFVSRWETPTHLTPPTVPSLASLYLSRLCLRIAVDRFSSSCQRRWTCRPAGLLYISWATYSAKESVEPFIPLCKFQPRV